MATIIESLLVRVGVDLSGLTKGMRGAERNILRASSKMRTAGTGLSLAVTAPLVAAGGAASHFSASFEKAMAKSTAIMGDLSATLQRELGDVARQVSKETTFSATQAADAYFFLASAGFSAKDSLLALLPVAKFATAGQFDLARATDLATDAQSALGLTIRGDSVKNLANLIRVQDALVKANTLANASTEQFAEALRGRAGPALRSVGKELEEGLAVLAVFADQGFKGEEASTRMAIAMRDLQTKAILNKDAFKAAKIAVFDATGDFRNMAEVVSDLEGHLSSMSDEQRKATLLMLGFSDRSVSALNSLIGTSKQIARFENELRKAGGTVNKVSAKQLANFSDRMKIMGNIIADVARTIGNELNPVIEELVQDFIIPVVKQLEDWAEAFSQLDAVTKKVIVVTTLIVAALGPLLLGLGLVAAAIGSLIGLVPALTTLFLGIAGALSAPVIAAVVAIGAALTASVSIWKIWGDDIKDIWNDVQSNILNISPQKFRRGTDEWKTFHEAVQKQFQDTQRATTPESRAASTAARTASIERFLGPLTPPVSSKPSDFRDLLKPIPRPPEFADDTQQLKTGGAVQFGSDLLKNLGASTIAFIEQGQAIGDAGRHAEALIGINSELEQSLAFVTAQEQVFGESLESNMAASRAAEEAIVQMLELGIDPMDERIQALSETLIDNRDAWEVWANDVGTFALDVTNLIFDAFQTLIEGIANAVARAIVFEENFAKASINLLKQIAVQIISQLISLGIQAIIAAIVHGAAAESKASAEIAGSAGSAAASAAASFIRDTGWLGIFGAAGIGALAAAAVTGSAAAGITAGHAVAQGVQLGEGGIVTGPTLALIGEGTETEVVQPLSDLKKFIGGAGGRSTVVQVFLDGEEVGGILGERIVNEIRDQGVEP